MAQGCFVGLLCCGAGPPEKSCQSLWGLKTALYSQGGKLAVSDEVKHTLTLWPSSPTSRFLPKREENVFPHKDVYTDVRSNFVPSSPKLETPQIFIHWRLDKQIEIHSCNRGRLGTKTEHTVPKSSTIPHLHTHHVGWENHVKKGHTVWWLLCVKLNNRQIYDIYPRRSSGYLRWGRGERAQGMSLRLGVPLILMEWLVCIRKSIKLDV